MVPHPLLEEKLNEALAPGPAEPMRRRDAELPNIPGKAHAVTGMRRAGKTTFLRQLAAQLTQAKPPRHAVHPSFDDDRLAELGADQLSALLEEFYRRFPELRRRASGKCVLWPTQEKPMRRYRRHCWF